MSRSRSPMKRPVWIIVLVCLVSMFVIGANIYDRKNSAGCYLFSSAGCAPLGMHEIVATRALTDDEMAVINEILSRPPLPSNNPKIAFMFLAPAIIPFEALWDIFFRGHEDKFSVYVHAPKEPSAHVSRYFAGRYICTDKYEKCIKDCDKAVKRGRELRSDFKMILKALTRKGSASVKMAKCSKDFEPAIETFQKALTEHRNPDTLKKLNDAERAKKELEQQEYFDPKIADEECEKGNEYFKQQKYTESLDVVHYYGFQRFAQ